MAGRGVGCGRGADVGEGVFKRRRRGEKVELWQAASKTAHETHSVNCKRIDASVLSKRPVGKIIALPE